MLKPIRSKDLASVLRVMAFAYKEHKKYLQLIPVMATTLPLCDELPSSTFDAVGEQWLNSRVGCASIQRGRGRRQAIHKEDDILTKTVASHC